MLIRIAIASLAVVTMVEAVFRKEVRLCGFVVEGVGCAVGGPMVVVVVGLFVQCGLDIGSDDEVPESVSEGWDGIWLRPVPSLPRE